MVKTINIALCIFYHESVEGVNFQGGFNNSFKSHNLRREDYYKSILQEKRLNIHTLSVLKRTKLNYRPQTNYSWVNFPFLSLFSLLHFE